MKNVKEYIEEHKVLPGEERCNRRFDEEDQEVAEDTTKQARKHKNVP